LALTPFDPASRTKYIGGTNTTSATYDSKGNLILGLDTPNTSSYQYDAQNRLLSANKGNTTMYFEYDGLNRQVSRRIGANGTRTFNIWDGWDLVEEYQGANPTAYYLYGATGLIASVANGQFNYYFQDGSGSTSHVTDENGNLKEWYRYDLQGTPFFYNSNDTQLSTSVLGVRHLFTGQQWYQELGLYDLRNRFYSPDIGRFLQPDPIGFDGDATNLYRYCGNNPVTRWDPFGLQVSVPTRMDGSGDPGWGEVERIEVTGSEIPLPEIQRGAPPDLGGLDRFGSGNFGPNGSGGPGGRGGTRGPTSQSHPGASNNNPTNPQQPPPQNPPSPSAPAPGVFSQWGAITPIIVGPVNMRLDDDGSGPDHNDKHHSKFTSYYWWYQQNLNADTVPYVVAPMSALQQGVQPGDVVFVIANGTWARSFVGDFGDSDNGWGEVSLAQAWSMGVPTVDAPWPKGPVIPNSYGPVPTTFMVIPSGLVVPKRH
jgi:RHS repeat-associated protein